MHDLLLMAAVIFIHFRLSVELVLNDLVPPLCLTLLVQRVITDELMNDSDARDL